MPYVKKKGDNRVCVHKQGSSDPDVCYTVGGDGIESMSQAESKADRYIAARYANEEGKFFPLELKTTSDGHYRIAGYGIVFGGSDLVGDVFTRETDVGNRSLKNLPVLYDHGMASFKGRIGKVTDSAVDEIGHWFEAELDKSSQYAQQVVELVRKGALGLSTRALDTLVEREGGILKTWYPVEISLTTTPAEPRTKLHLTLKSIGGEVVEEETITSRPVVEFSNDDRKGGESVDENTGELKTLRDMVATQSKQIDQLLTMYNENPEVKSGKVGGKKEDEALQFGHYLKAIYQGDKERLVKVFGSKPADSMKADPADSLGEMTGSRGGYTVPEQFVAQLMSSAAEVEHIFPRAFRIPSAGREMVIPTLDYSGSHTSGQSQMLAGMVMNWTGENSTISTTKPKFRQVRLENHKLSGIVPASNELLADSAIALQQVLVRLFGQAIGWHRDYAFLHGLGDGEPLGVLNAPALVTTATFATDLDIPDVTAMYKHLMPSSRSAAMWMIGIEHEDELLNINATAGTGNPSVLTYLPNLNGTIEPRLLGLPVVTTDKLVGSAISSESLVLCDFGQYVVSDRINIDIAMSSDAGFEDDQTLWRCNARFDGRPWINNTINVTSTHEVSPFVALGAS